MDCYDSVVVVCNSCFNPIVIVSNTGPNNFNMYKAEHAPLSVLAGIHDRLIYCEKCGAQLKIEVKAEIITNTL
jgi:hypothetical protein